MTGRSGRACSFRRAIRLIMLQGVIMTARPAGSARHWMRLGAAFLAFSAQSGLPPVTISPPPPLPSNTIDLGLGRTTGTYSIRLPAKIEAERCHLEVHQAGAFGGLSGFVSPKIERNTLTVATGAQGKPAQRLKAIVWCPGYAVGLIDEPALEQSTRERELTLQTLPNIEINARVLAAPDSGNLTGDEVRVIYVATWACLFFQLVDCWVPSWPVANATIGTNGVLRLAVPDFAADPAVKAYSFPGEFKLDVQSGAYSLEAVDAAGDTHRSIGVSSRYPTLITFQQRQR